MKLFIFLAAVLFPSQAFAYFDPGTGSMLIQVAVGAIAGVAVFWGKIKRAISSWFFSKKNIHNKTDEEQ